MVDTIRLLADLQTLLADNATGDISEQDMRDVLVSSLGGFGAYEDLATKTTRLAGTANIAFDYECDGLGANTDTDHLPYPKAKVTDELWDATNDRILLANLQDGERLSVRLDFTLNPANPNAVVIIITSFYNSSDVKIFDLELELAEVKATGDKPLLAVIPFFVGSAITDGFVRFEILCSTDSTVETGGVYINVTR